MSLDTSFHMIYGYRMNNSKLTDDIQKYTSEEKNWILPNGVDYDTFEEELCNANDLSLVKDYMCGEYEYLGIPLFESNAYAYDDWWKEFNPTDIPNLCDDEKLDKLIHEKIPFIVGNEYDEAGLMYGNLPKLYVVKRVW